MEAWYAMAYPWDVLLLAGCAAERACRMAIECAVETCPWMCYWLYRFLPGYPSRVVDYT